MAERVGVVSRRVWRVGHAGSPLEFVPHEYCSWEHRFDDPERRYRTLYGAQHLLEELATRHATLLAEHGMAQLNISEIRSKSRPVTQAISRDLYERGAAGLLFRSNQDDKPCVVLLEGRARFVAGTGARTLPAIWRP